jgi:hypothetical protein
VIGKTTFKKLYLSLYPKIKRWEIIGSITPS